MAMFDGAFSILSIIWTSINSWLTPTILFLLLNLMIATIFITSGFASSANPHHHDHHDTAIHQPSQITRAPSVLQRLKSINFYSSLHQPILPHNVPQSQQFQNLSPVSDPFLKPTPKLEPEEFSRRAEFETRTQTLTLAIEDDIFHYTRPTKTQTRPKAPTIEEDIFHNKWPTQIKTQTQIQNPEEVLEDIEGPTLDEIYNKIKGTSSVHYNRQNSDTKPTGGEIPVRLPAKLKKSASDKSAFNHFQAVEESENADSVAEKNDVSAAVVTEAIGGSEVDARADDFISKFKKQLQLQRLESIVRYKEMITRGSDK